MIRLHLQYLGEGIQIQISDCGQEMAEHLDMLLQSSAAVRHHCTAQELLQSCALPALYNLLVDCHVTCTIAFAKLAGC